jgi:DnaJ-class molecular chaperone
MEHRSFFVALGIPRGADTRAIQVAYRRVVSHYRDALDGPDPEPPGEEALASFSVLRTYSERRHATLMEQHGPPPAPAGEVDRFFGGFVPEVPDTPRARRRGGKDLFVELRITAREARAGGIFPVHIPVLRPCPVCEQREERERLVCKACAGHGQLTEDRMIEVTVPPEVRHDQLASVAMQDVGLGRANLVVHVLVV